jgi:TolB protein
MLTGCRSVTSALSSQASHEPINDRTNQLAFVSDVTGQKNIHILAIDSGQVNQVTHTLDDECCPAWSPDGKRLAFGARNQIFVVNIDGTRRIQLSSTPGKWEAFTPTWSPDGKQLAVASHGNIFIMPVDESATDTSTWIQGTHSGNNITPAWLPQGDRLAFTSVKEDSAEIYTVRSDGSDIQRLSIDAAPYTKLAWSPDGTQLAFVSTRAGNQDIYLLHADGTTPVRLTSNPAQDTFPTWSPDGRSVAFATNRADNWDIYAVGADGTNEHPLIQTPANEEYPAWHP